MKPPPFVRQENALNVRWWTRRDLMEAVAIERASHPFPWSEEEILAHLRSPHSQGRVATIGSVVVGFSVYYELGRALRLDDLAVHPGFRRRGVGKALVARLLSELHPKRNMVFLTVRETNMEAQLFLKSQRFEAKKVIRGFYKDSGEDAYSFKYLLPADSVVDTAETGL